MMIQRCFADATRLRFANSVLERFEDFNRIFFTLLDEKRLGFTFMCMVASTSTLVVMDFKISQRETQNST